MNSVLKMGALKKQETLGLPVLEPPLQGPAQKMFVQRGTVEPWRSPLKAGAPEAVEGLSSEARYRCSKAPIDSSPSP
jgi:hypothetical protein